MTLGIYVVLQVRTLALGERQVHRRFISAWAALARKTSLAPADLSLAGPLLDARCAAAEGRHDAVEAFVREVNAVLAAEVSDWMATWGYRISQVGARQRLTSYDLLSSRPGEFHPQALPEPYVTLSSHTAPDVRPLPWHRGQ